MLKANPEAIRPLHGDVWFPGRIMEGFVAVSPLSASRALEIAKRRDELLCLLHDLPDSQRELSFSDLVVNTSAADDSAASCDVDGPPRQGERSRPAEAKKMRRQSSSSSFGGNSVGVLLNFYVPASLARSLTARRSSRGSFRRGSTPQSSKREMDHTNFGCWSALSGTRRRANQGQK